MTPSPSTIAARRRAFRELHAAGCTTPQIASITGHSLKTVDEILRFYIVTTATVADEAAARRLAYTQPKEA